MWQAHAATDAISTVMWKRALQALSVGVEAATHPDCNVSIQVPNKALSLERLSHRFPSVLTDGPSLAPSHITYAAPRMAEVRVQST